MVGRAQGGEAHVRHLGDVLGDVDVVQGYRGQHLVGATGQALQHGGGFVGMRRLAEDLAVDGDGGVGRQHRAQRHAAQGQHLPGERPLFARHPLHIVERRFAGALGLADVGPRAGIGTQAEQFEFDADLAQQFAPARAFRSEVDFFVEEFHGEGSRLPRLCDRGGFG
jgi:hypothetical protein